MKNPVPDIENKKTFRISSDVLVNNNEPTVILELSDYASIEKYIYLLEKNIQKLKAENNKLENTLLDLESKILDLKKKYKRFDNEYQKYSDKSRLLMRFEDKLNDYYPKYFEMEQTLILVEKYKTI